MSGVFEIWVKEGDLVVGYNVKCCVSVVFDFFIFII